MFYQELFDFPLRCVDIMDASQVAHLVYECGRHGLRCKHMLDTNVNTAFRRIICDEIKSKGPASSISREEIIQALTGLCKTAEDYLPFVSVMAPCVRARLDQYSLAELTVLFRVYRVFADSKHRLDPGDSVRKLATDILVASKNFCEEKKMQQLRLVDVTQFVYICKNSRNRCPAWVGPDLLQPLIAQMADQVCVDQIRSELMVTDISDCLDSLASWKIKNEKVLKMFVTVLTERMAEIKYSPICGLWQAITDSMGHLRYFNADWMRSIQPIASDPFQLRSFASFQLIFFTSCLGRLNFFSPQMFTAITDTLIKDIHQFHDCDMIATLTFPIERAQFSCPPLLRRVLEQCGHIIDQNGTRSSGNVRGCVKKNMWRGALLVLHNIMASPDFPELLRTNRSHIDLLLSYVIDRLSENKAHIAEVDHARVNRLIHLTELLGVTVDPSFNRLTRSGIEQLDQIRRSREIWFDYDRKRRPFVRDMLTTLIAQKKSLPADQLEFDTGYGFNDVRIGDVYYAFVPYHEFMRTWAADADSSKPLRLLDQCGITNLIDSLSRFHKIETRIVRYVDPNDTVFDSAICHSTDEVSEWAKNL